MRTTLSLLILSTIVTNSKAGDNWPQFRGPTGDGHADVRNLPTKWSEKENILWKTAIHDKGWSSPVIWGDQVWMTTAREDGKEYFAVCVDRKTGKVLHDVKVFSEEKPAFCHPFNSYASPTPVVEEGRVYVHFGSHGTASLDTASGKVLWERRDLPCDHFRGPGSSPILFENMVILTFDGFDLQYIAALDKTTGKTVWKTDRNIKFPKENGDYRKAYSTPALFQIDGKWQMIAPAAEATIAYDPKTGKELWRVITGGMNQASRPVAGHNLIYLTTGHTGQVWAVHEGPAAGMPKEGVAWKERGGPTRPSMLLVGDLLFMVNDSGIACCRDAKTGKQLWQERLGGLFSSSPIYAAGNIYAFDQDGRAFVFAASPTFKLLATNQLDAGCMASPAAVGDCLFVRTKTHLYCIGTR